MRTCSSGDGRTLRCAGSPAMAIGRRASTPPRTAMSPVISETVTPVAPAPADAPSWEAASGGHSDVLDRLFPVVFGDRDVLEHMLGAADREEFSRRLALTAARNGIELS